jgi:hypothetical protein
MTSVLALFPPYVTKMKEGENKEETGLKQGGNIARFRRRNGHLYGFFQAAYIAAKCEGKCSYLR